MPRVSKAQTQAHREQILESAARIFRERGFDGVSVADLMAEAGLTHGGFYGHFDSKEELMACAFARAGEQGRERWRKLIGEHGDKTRSRQDVVDYYLSPTHRDRAGHGCHMAALASDVARNPEAKELRELYTASIHRWADTLASLQPPTVKPTARRRQALAELASLVGAMLLARATKGDPVSEEILSAVHDTLLPEKRKEKKAAAKGKPAADCA